MQNRRFFNLKIALLINDVISQKDKDKSFCVVSFKTYIIQQKRRGEKNLNCKGEGNKLDELVETINFSKNIVKKIKKVAEVIIDFDSELTKKNYHAVADETKQMIQDF